MPCQQQAEERELALLILDKVGFCPQDHNNKEPAHQEDIIVLQSFKTHEAKTDGSRRNTQNSK